MIVSDNILQKTKIPRLQHR